MSSSTSSETNIVNTISAALSNTAITSTETDNYVNNTINNAMTTALSICGEMKNIVDTLNKTQIDAAINSVLNSYINLENISNSTISVMQQVTNKQYVYGYAYIKAINNIQADTTSTAIASDILQATQGVDTLTQAVQDIIQDADLSAAIEEAVSAMQTSQLTGAGNSSDDVSNNIKNQTKVDIANMSKKIASYTNTDKLTQNYTNRIKENIVNKTISTSKLKNNMEIYSNITATLNSVITGKNWNKVNLVVSQVDVQTQEISENVVTYYENYMYDTMYNYLNRDVLNKTDQVSSHTTVNTDNVEATAAATISEAIKTETKQSSSNTSSFSNLVDKASSLMSGIGIKVALVIIAIVAVLGIGAVILIVMLKKVLTNKNTLGTIQTIATNENVLNAVSNASKMAAMA